ncbi:PIG-L family deacetylase [Actinokineospora bangkokensis]|uniref:GlcNAc-PI de-N-acetylase n=1 Tax=Actinokineospora bangkokensis TaxID=1193682 RepID=A0A1Q9LCS8_9PSEU|nr:PIG-L family deacetylase [Actinokineospora bangkokensis]OLR89806.1 GlcNAc-PI de-N-acetylase [Actinokineospora bangkokensis]
MATLVTFHAHPDDECISCGGVMRKAADEGHRVVLVVATRGELGEVPDGFLDEGEQLWERRVKETHAAADVLGVARVEFLGYTDSGMMGEPTNTAPGTFWTADVEEAATRLAAILTEESADVLTVYDDFGGYGHPDHIQVHRVGLRAAELAGTPRVLQATTSQERMREGMRRFREAGLMPPPAEGEGDGDPAMGKPEAELTCSVDVSAYLDAKRRAMRAHPSQIAEESFFLALPDDAFAQAFGIEDFIEVGKAPGIVDDDIMHGL